MALGFPTGAIFHRNSGSRSIPVHTPSSRVASTQECERSTPPLPVNTTETTKLLDSPFTAINATRTDRSTLRGRDRLQLISGSAAGERHPTNNASRREKVFATWWPPIRCRRESRIGEQWYGNAAGACAGESGCPLLPLSSLEFSPSPQPVWCTVPDPPLSLLLALVTRFRSPNEKKMLK